MCYWSLMTRSEAIAIINAKLANLDDEAILIVQDMGSASLRLRRLSARELELIEQSKADFREGRTYSIEEARRRSDAHLLALRAKYPSAP